LRSEAALGAANVRTTTQHIDRHAGGDLQRCDRDRLAFGQYCFERAGWIAGQHRKPVHRFDQRRLQRRDRSTRLLIVALRLLDVERGSETGRCPPLRDVEHAALRFEILLGEREPRLRRAHIDVAQRDVAEQRHEHVAKILPGWRPAARWPASNARRLPPNRSSSQPESSPAV
jgi:hypothetical protein